MILITENLSTLKIHKLSQEQYSRTVVNGQIEANTLYLTPDEAPDETLSISGAPADAKAVGDALAAIECTDAIDDGSGVVTLGKSVTSDRPIVSGGGVGEATDEGGGTMAIKRLKGINFPGLEDTYVVQETHIIPIHNDGRDNIEIDANHEYDFNRIFNAIKQGDSVICREYYLDGDLTYYDDYHLMQCDDNSETFVFGRFDENCVVMLTVEIDRTLTKEVRHLITQESDAILSNICLRNGVNYGTEEQMNALSNPQEGQLFFVING